MCRLEAIRWCSIRPKNIRIFYPIFNRIVIVITTLVACQFINYYSSAEDGDCVVGASSSGPLLRSVDTDDFYQLVTDTGGIFVDKSLLIKEYFETDKNITLITRPRRFGKTLNINMLKRFLELETTDNAGGEPQTSAVNRKLFAVGGIDNNISLEISGYKDIIRQHQGKYPVISVSFKNVYGNSYNEIERSLKLTIAGLYERHSYLERTCYYSDKSRFQSYRRYHQLIKNARTTTAVVELEQSLHFLSYLLERHHKRKVHILLDDYDRPFDRLTVTAFKTMKNNNNNNTNTTKLLEKVFDSADYRRTDILIRQLFRKSFIENEALAKAFITGTLPVMPFNRSLSEKIIIDCTSLLPATGEDRCPYFDYYGFDFVEAAALLDHPIFETDLSVRDFYGFQDERHRREVLGKLRFKTDLNGIVEWYGDRFNTTSGTLLCPWSVMHCLSNGGQLDVYWTLGNENNTGLEDEIFASDEIQDAVQQLLNGEGIHFDRSPPPVFDYPISSNSDDNVGLYNLLYFTGYLRYYEGAYYIFSGEVKRVCEEKSARWVTDKLNAKPEDFTALADYLSNFDVIKFKKKIQRLLSSAPDEAITTNNGGNEYLYLTVIKRTIERMSAVYEDGILNKQGLIRPDIVLLSKPNQTDKAIVIKYKISDTDERFEVKIRDGLHSIDRQTYKSLRRAKHINRVLKLCILFSGKTSFVAYKIDRVSHSSSSGKTEDAYIPGAVNIIGSWKTSVIESIQASSQQQPPVAYLKINPIFRQRLSPANRTRDEFVCPTEEHAISFPRLANTELREYCVAMRKRVKEPGNIIAISEPDDRRVIVYLRDEQMTRLFAFTGANIVVRNVTVKGKLLSPIRKLSFSRVPPTVPNALLRHHAERALGVRFISAVIVLPAIPTDREYGHIAGTQREVYACNVENRTTFSSDQPLNVTYHGYDYTIGVKCQNVICYKCGSTRHKTVSCQEH